MCRNLKKIISAIMVIVLLIQTIIINLSAQNDNVSAIFIVSVTNTDLQAGELRVEFNKPVRISFDIIEIALFEDSKNEHPFINIVDKSQIIAENAINKNGSVYSQSYVLDFGMEIKQNGFLKIKDFLFDGVIGGVSDIDGNMLLCDSSDDIDDIFVSYNIINHLVQVSVLEPRKLNMDFLYETDVLVKNLNDYIYVEGDNGKIYKPATVNAVSKTSYSILFEDILPERGKLIICEKEIDSNKYMDQIFYSESFGFIIANDVEDENLDSITTTFINPWIYFKNISYLNPDKIKITLNNQLTFAENASPEKLFKLCFDTKEKETVEVLKIEDVSNSSEYSYILYLDGNVTRDCFLKVFCNLQTEDGDVLHELLNEIEEKSFYTETEKTSDLKLKVLKAPIITDAVPLSARMVDEKTIDLRFNYPVNISGNYLNEIYIEGTNDSCNVQTVSKIDDCTYRLVFNCVLSEKLDLKIDKTILSSERNISGGLFYENESIISIPIENESKLLSAEAISDTEGLVRLKFSNFCHIGNGEILFDSGDNLIAYDRKFKPVYENSIKINGKVYSESMIIRFGSEENTEPEFLIPDEGSVRLKSAGALIENTFPPSSFEDYSGQGIITEKSGTVIVKCNTNVYVKLVAAKQVSDFTLRLVFNDDVKFISSYPADNITITDLAGAKKVAASQIYAEDGDLKSGAKNFIIANCNSKLKQN